MAAQTGGLDSALGEAETMTVDGAAPTLGLLDLPLPLELTLPLRLDDIGKT